MELVIKSAEIKNSLFLKYSFEQKTSSCKNSGNLTSDQPIHDDLRNAFRALIPHFTFICEEITDEALVRKAIDSPEDYLTDEENAEDKSFFKYRVYAITLKGKDEAEQIVISGSKKLTSGKSIALSTPEQFLDANDYVFSQELYQAVELLKSEIIAYIDGKQADKVQVEMEFDENQEQLEFNDKEDAI